MLDDILSFSAATLVDGGRLAFWMPTSNEESEEILPPSHPCLRIVTVCSQDFNKCTCPPTCLYPLLFAYFSFQGSWLYSLLSLWISLHRVVANDTRVKEAHRVHEDTRRRGRRGRGQGVDGEERGQGRGHHRQRAESLSEDVLYEHKGRVMNAHTHSTTWILSCAVTLNVSPDTVDFHLWNGGIHRFLAPLLPRHLFSVVHERRHHPGRIAPRITPPLPARFPISQSRRIHVPQTGQAEPPFTELASPHQTGMTQQASSTTARLAMR